MSVEATPNEPKSKVVFKKCGDWYTHCDPEAMLMWQQGVFVTGFSDTHVFLGSIRGPVGEVLRDIRINAFIDKFVEYEK